MLWLWQKTFFFRILKQVKSTEQNTKEGKMRSIVYNKTIS